MNTMLEAAASVVSSVSTELPRIIFAIVVGIVIGWDRERKGRPAGVKTHAIVCMSSALVMMTGEHVFLTFGIGEITRLGAQVVSGIGFLGAGAIILTGSNKVTGLTTAASIWGAGCIGLAVGIGYFSGASVTLAGILFTFLVLGKIEKLISAHSKAMDIYIETKNIHCVGEIISMAKAMGIRIIDVNVTRPKDKVYKKKSQVIAVLLSIYLKESSQRHTLLLDLNQNENIEMIEEV